MKKIKFRHLAAAFYLAALLFWLCFAVPQAMCASRLQAQEISPDAFTLQSVKTREESYSDFEHPFVSTDGDAQMLYPGKVTLGSVSFCLRGHIPTGTPALFYRYAEDEPFKELRPTEFDPETGRYLFRFKVLKDVQLRIDPVTAPGCVFELSQLVFNPEANALRRLIPTGDVLAVLAFCPLLCAVLLRELAAQKKTRSDQDD